MLEKITSNPLHLGMILRTKFPVIIFVVVDMFCLDVFHFLGQKKKRKTTRH